MTPPDEHEPDFEPATPASDDDRGDAPVGGGEADGPLLSQEEIDSLLGVGQQEERSSGLELLVHNTTVSYERLPMLEVVFDRLVRIMTTSLRNFTSENVEVALDRIESMRFKDFLDGVSLPALIAVFRAVEWDNFGLITVDSPLIYSIVDVLLGGRRGTAPVRNEGRAFTTIERSLVERLIQLVLQDLEGAFEPLSKVTFRFERLETNPRFTAIARPTNAAIMFRIRVDMDDRGGILQMLVPYATFEPVRDLLLQMFMGEKFGRDTIWETHLAREMLETEVEMEALLGEQLVPLSAVMGLEVGSTLSLHTKPDKPVMLRCGHVPLLSGQLGRVSDTVAVRIEDRIGHTTEFE